MKKHNILKVVLFSLLAVVVLTWIFPTSTFSTTLTVGKRAQMGIFDIFSYFGQGFQYFYQILIYALIVGGFYGVLSKIEAYRKLLDKIVDSFKGREILFISIVTIIFALLAGGVGLSYILIFLFPFVISILLLMGFDKLLAATVTVGSVLVGVMGSLYTTDVNYYLNNYLSLGISDEIITKIIVLVISVAILLFNVIRYAKKTKAKKVKEEEVEEYVPAKTKTKAKTWPLVVVIDVFLLVVALAMFSWASVFGLSFFDNITTAVTKFSIGGFPIFGKLLGSVQSFGNWDIMTVGGCLVIATIILALCYKVKVDDFFSSFGKGVKKSLTPAFIMYFIYLILIIVTYNNFQLTIYSWILNLSKGFNVITTTLTAFLSSLFNVELLYSINSVGPYLVSIVTDTSAYPLIGIIFQSIYGLVMLVAPTSVILMGTLAYLDIPYGKWLKHIWKVFVELLVVLLIIFTIVALV